MKLFYAVLTLNFSPFPELTAERLLLKQITNGHAGDVFKTRADKEVMKYIDRPIAKTTEDALALIKIITEQLQKNNGITWGIF